jgi:hypothetical protein
MSTTCIVTNTRMSVCDAPRQTMRSMTPGSDTPDTAALRETNRSVVVNGMPYMVR